MAEDSEFASDGQEFSPFRTKQTLILPEKFVRSLSDAIADIDYVYNNEDAMITLVRSVIAFRKRNNINQRELTLALNLGYYSWKVTQDFEAFRKLKKSDFSLFVNALKDFVEETTGYVSWVDVSDGRFSHQIQCLQVALAKAVEAAQSINDDPQRPVFASQLLRKQLIAMLKAAIAELDAPKIDKGRLSQIMRFLGSLSFKIATGAGTKVLGDSIGESMKESGKLLDALKDIPGTDQFF